MRSGLASLALLVLGWLLAGVLSNGGHASAAQPRLPPPEPLLRDYARISSSATPPPTQAQCFAANRRCFTPQGIRAAYNLQPLYDAGHDGRGHTIAIVDSFGSPTIAHDLHVFNQAFGLQPMCGEEGVTCAAGMPKFSTLAPQGSPATKAPSQSSAPGQADKSAWALEVAVDVETAHAVAPGANILLVTTPTAETLGVHGLPQMMAAEQYVVDHHLADVISQSFASAEEGFPSAHSIESLRHAFKSAAENGVTVLAASGDTGTANDKTPPVGTGGTTINSPTVVWPASDPLVTSIGGTALCTDANASTRVVDSADPPAACGAAPGQAEIAWGDLSRGIATGGGFSHVFPRPDYQAALPTGSAPIPEGQRGVPDVALQASPRTAYLVYISLPQDGQGGLRCDTDPCSGWYDAGGTSLATPQWAGLIAIAAQMKGSGLGLINPALYSIANDPAKYANDYFDITAGNNQADQDIPGYPATPGWDPTTGLGTPNAANLLPDLVAATP